ncbi:hypothetical protein LY76DRAFT_595676 [Colletotrichum caudatum]|nr:hypothetical protein LY76DRAFT_595676 [Colletotrichum caudatum]
MRLLNHLKHNHHLHPPIPVPNPSADLPSGACVDRQPSPASSVPCLPLHRRLFVNVALGSLNPPR